MTDRLAISIDSAAILAALTRTSGVLEQPLEMLADVGAQLEANIRLRFTTRTDPAGQAWEPLAPGTLKKYQKQYKGRIPGGLLRRSGLLLGSLASDVQGAALEVGFSAPYAIFHATGTRHMPRRDSLFAAIAKDFQTATLGPQDEADILEIIEEHLRDALGDAAA